MLLFRVSTAIEFLLEWLRLPGDALFILGGVLPVLYLAWLGVRRPKAIVDSQKPGDLLLSEVAEAVLER